MQVWPDGADIAEQSLQIGGVLGKGGEGSVVELGGLYSGLVYKRYFSTSADAAALRRLVDLRAMLSPSEAARLRRQTAWPVARVMNGGIATGFIMQKIPNRFYGRSGTDSMLARELQYLLYEQKPMWGDIVPPAAEGRLALVREIASLMHFLHSHLLIAGDISMNNLLWAYDSAPGVFLIDCDSVRRLGRRPVHPPAATLDWDDPKRTGSQVDLDNDRYKCALLIGRVLSRSPYIHPGQQLETLPIPEHISSAVQALWRQAARARGSRPDASQWMAALANH